ncbi:MAG: Fic family protein [Actinobacteria bacterium]|nr:Fic family protein [Actinomycetota bacterium]
MAIFTSDDLSRSELQRRTAGGTLQRLAPGIYSDDTVRSPEQIVAGQWRTILGKVMPGAVISYANGFDGNPINGELNVAHPRRRPLELPGLTVRTDMIGRRDDDDIDLGTGIYLASPARALIDNSQDHPGRPLTRVTKLSREQLHDQIVRIVQREQPARADQLLAQVDARAPKAVSAGIAVFFAAARAQIHTVDTPSRAMRAAQSGEGYDQARVMLFRRFAEELTTKPPIARYDTMSGYTATVPFWEAYFSNFIEGTEFTVEEAERVVYEGADLGRPEDAHDIAGTFEIVSSPAMRTPPRDADDFLDALRGWHATMMRLRPATGPGQWKNRANRAGSTEFVAPALVPGTLRAGWEEGEGLDDPFRRATYLMFLVSEVHPFLDGNGRSARIAMNNALAVAGQHRIIIPTIQRNSYLDTLTRASNNGGPDGLFRVLDHAQHWVARGDWSTIATGLDYAQTTHALVTARDAEQNHIHLQIPVWEQVAPLTPQTRRNAEGEPPRLARGIVPF